MIGDVVGAVVEAETPEYISKRFATMEALLATDSVEEFATSAWKVGRFTDDTQMSLSVARWLLEDPSRSPSQLLGEFSRSYEPCRRYGPGTEMILKLYRDHPQQWRELATAMFPHGSYGNGGAMRVAPIGLAFRGDLKKVAETAKDSCRVTHSHPLALQGAAMQAMAVAIATSITEVSVGGFVDPVRRMLNEFEDLLQDTSKFTTALDRIEAGLGLRETCLAMSTLLGTGIEAFEAVPMAMYCFLRHPDSFVDAVTAAVFIGGDTDTIASMTGAIAGAFHGCRSIPTAWLQRVQEETYTVDYVGNLADQLFEAFAE